MAFIRHFHHAGLGHASHLVGDEAAGVAAVIDPARDIAPYLEAAIELGVTIVLALDTHAHSDYLSGVGAFVEAGVQAMAPVGASVGYAAELAWHGRRVALGDLELELLHTPGHTPEHTAVLVHGLGEAGATLLSGGSLLVGDVGRPDLLGGSAAREAAARAFVATVRDTLLALPDATEVRPTHVGGSLCAGAIGSERTTTIGAQRTDNPSVRAMLAAPDEVDAWVRPTLLPPVPAFWPRMRAANLRGVPAPRRGGAVAPARLAPVDAAARLADGVVTVLDVRSAAAWKAVHVRNALHVPSTGSFAVWSATVLPAQGEVLLVADSAEQAHAAHRELLLVREEGADAWLPGAVLGELPASLLEQGGVLSADELAERLEEGVVLVDVRNPLEQAERPLAGAHELPAAVLAGEPDLLPGGPVALACASGMRAMVLASHLRRHGRDDIAAVDGPAFDAATAAASARMLLAVGSGPASGGAW